MLQKLIDIYYDLKNTIDNGRQLNFLLENTNLGRSLLNEPIKIIPKWVLKAERSKRGAPEPIDLGLSVLWAGKNIGSPSEEQPGYYVGWGDVTAENASMDYDDYPSHNPPANICRTEYDIARKMWEESWRLPTRNEMQELMRNCKWIWTEKNGIPGYLITGENGNSIFLPAGGSRYGFNYEDGWFYGRYWCGELNLNDKATAFSLEFSQLAIDVTSRSRFIGMLIRPVFPKNSTNM